MKDCFGYVYKFTHRETGKWYIGSHNGSKENYSGSGTIWRNAKEKYGIENFIKEILYEGENCREIEELVLMTLDAKNDPMSYNLKNESIGGAFHGEANGMFGKKMTEEQKYKCGNAFRGKKRPDHSEKMKGENNPRFGKTEHAHGIVAKAKANKGKTLEEIHGVEKASLIKKHLSIVNTGVKKPKISERQRGHLNSSAKKILIDGIEYGCIVDAMRILGLSRHKVKQIGVEI